MCELAGVAVFIHLEGIDMAEGIVQYKLCRKSVFTDGPMKA